MQEQEQEQLLQVWLRRACMVNFEPLPAVHAAASSSGCPRLPVLALCSACVPVHFPQTLKSP